MTHPIAYPRWLPALLVWALLLLVVRVLLAGQLQLFGDEAFYRWESHNLAWSYSDLPPLTALSMRLGTELWGDSLLALRSLFVFSGLSLPLAIYFLAQPITGSREAVASAGLSLLLPATATLGVLAVPDALLLTQCAVMLGCLQRACRSEGLGWWLATGITACLGFLIHYRFVFLPATLGLAFLCYPALRATLARPGPWLAAAIALAGLLPALIFNLGNDFEAVGFHFGRRHPWSFHSEGLSYSLQQAAVVSPLLYGLILAALVSSLRLAVAGDRDHALLSSASLFYILGLSVLAPWLDQTSTTIHWAWFGYVPMLVVLPALLQQLWRRSARWRALVVGSLGLAAVFVLVTFGMMFAPLHFERLPSVLQDSVSVKMVGWDELRRRAARWYRPGENLYSGEYYVAAQLQQPPFVSSHTIVLDQEKIHRDGRARQLYLWQATESFTPADGSGGLVVLDYETGNRNEIYRQIDFLCRHFEQLQTVEEFSLFNGRRQYGIYRAQGARSGQSYATRPVSDLCLPHLRGSLDSLREFREARSGTAAFRGWLLAQPEGITAVKVRIDGRLIEGRYGVSRGDTRRVLGALIADPNYPLVGFEGEIDTTLFANGVYEMEFFGVTAWGREEVFKRVQLEVAN